MQIWTLRNSRAFVVIIIVDVDVIKSQICYCVDVQWLREAHIS